jgi:tripartite-type tricarboxylate transporter receptor subunit TctC
MIVSKDLPVKNLGGFIAYAKANPGTVNFGAPTGTPSHLLVELFKTLTGTPTVIVPYKGGSPVITDLMGGQIQASFEQTSVLLPHIQEGKVRALAVAQDHRIKDLPDVPTTAESGVPRLVGTSWTGVAAPAGTPDDIVAKLNAAINAKLATPEMRANMARLGSEPTIMSVAEFTAFMKAEALKWGKLVELSGAKGD